eukprot:gene7372-8192_t
MSFSLPIFKPRLSVRFKDHSRSRSFGFPKRFTPTRKRISFSSQYEISTHPTNIRLIRLCSRNQNVFLQVNPNGIVNGTHNANSKYTNLEQESLGVSVVRLRGVATRRYIAMNRQGRIYSTLVPNTECIFNTRHEENFYHSFWSYAYEREPKGWLLSVKKNGKMRRGIRTTMGEKSTHFSCCEIYVCGNSLKSDDELRMKSLPDACLFVTTIIW